MTNYPFVPGHEGVGRIVRVGDTVHRLKVGQRVGVGWFSRSCRECHQCLSGDQNLCPTAEQTIVGRHGAFATHVKLQGMWATPIPE
ncbi:alcohol dehydrogenase catalytic domain-containing protein, partial [Acinetobacter baumannii]